MFQKLGVQTFATALLAAAALSGCVTEVRKGAPSPGGTNPDRAATPKAHVLDDLQAKVDKDPKDPQGWFEFGLYWEDSMDYVKAAQCYERGNELLDQSRWTGGNYHLGKVYFRMEQFELAMRHLDAVIHLESPDPKIACVNSDFSEAHYLKGAMFYIRHRWRDARKEFLRFVELGGESNRVDEFLDRIDQETR